MSAVKCKVEGKEFRMTPENTEIFLFPEPFEELSCVTHKSKGEKLLLWDWGLMEALSKAGVQVLLHDAEPPAECIDLYAKDQARRIDEEWLATSPS